MSCRHLLYSIGRLSDVLIGFRKCIIAEPDLYIALSAHS